MKKILPHYRDQKEHKKRGKTTSISQGRRTIKAFFYFLYIYRNLKNNVYVVRMC